MHYEFKTCVFVVLLYIGNFLDAQELLRESTATIESLTLEGKHYGSYGNSGSSVTRGASNPQSGDIYYSHKTSIYEGGNPIIGYDGQIIYLKAGKTGLLNIFKEGFFEGQGKSAPTKVATLRGYVSGNLPGFALSGGNFGFWGEANSFKAVNLNTIDENFDASKLAWEKTLVGAVTTFPICLPNNHVVFGHDPNMLVCLNGQTGDTVWEKNIGFGFTSINYKYFCAGYKGYLHLLNENKVITLNTSDGSLAWEYVHDEGTYLSHPRVSYNGNLYFLSNKPSSSPNTFPSPSETNIGGVACINLNSQKLIWESRYDFIINGMTLGDNNNLFFLEAVYPKLIAKCLDSSNGKEQWGINEDNFQSKNNFFLDNAGRWKVGDKIYQTTSTGLDKGPWPSTHGSYYNRRQGVEQELSNANTNQSTSSSNIPSSISIDEQWGWMKLPWIYVNAIKSWVYYTISGSTSVVYSNKYKAWYRWDANTETWVLVD